MRQEISPTVAGKKADTEKPQWSPQHLTKATKGK